MCDRVLADLVEPGRKICYGIVQPGKPVDDGIPLLRVNNFSADGLNTDDVLKIDPAIHAKYPRSQLRGGELLVTLVGSVGQSTIAPANLAGWNVARAIGVVPIADPVLRRWASYIVRSKPAQRFFNERANTTVQTTVNLRDLAALPVPLLPRKEIESVISILGAIDDKIELNRQMNETLEASARALFRDWFVDFGPTKAKMAGATPYLAPDLWALFPDQLDDDGVPNGWEGSTVGQHCVNFDSKRVPVSKGERAKRQGSYPYHGATSVMDHVDDYLFDGIYVLVGEDGSVVNSDGHAFTQYVSGKIWVNNHAHVLQGKNCVSTEQIFLFFRHAQIGPYITGAVQLKLSQGRMNKIPFVFASEAICNAFRLCIEPFFDRIRANEAENITLAQTRDLLLPKLMSGEIRIRDAEKTVSEQL